MAPPQDQHTDIGRALHTAVGGSGSRHLNPAPKVPRRVTPNLPRRQAERRGLRLWPVGIVLTLTFATAIGVAASVFLAGWDLLGAQRLKPEKQLTSSTLFDLVKLSFGVVAGAGALLSCPDGDEGSVVQRGLRQQKVLRAAVDEEDDVVARRVGAETLGGAAVGIRGREQGVAAERGGSFRQGAGHPFGGSRAPGQQAACCRAALAQSTQDQGRDECARSVGQCVGEQEEQGHGNLAEVGAARRSGGQRPLGLMRGLAEQPPTR